MTEPLKHVFQLEPEVGDLLLVYPERFVVMVISVSPAEDPSRGSGTRQSLLTTLLLFPDGSIKLGQMRNADVVARMKEAYD